MFAVIMKYTALSLKESLFPETPGNPEWEVEVKKDLDHV